MHYPKELVLFPHAACTSEEWAWHLCMPILTWHDLLAALRLGTRKGLYVGQVGRIAAQPAKGNLRIVGDPEMVAGYGLGAKKPEPESLKKFERNFHTGVEKT